MTLDSSVIQGEWRSAVVCDSSVCLGLFQVSRNCELVGRVNLDQLEQMKEKMESSSSDDEDKEEEMNSKADDRGWSLSCPPSPRWHPAWPWGDRREAEGCWRRNRRNDPSSLSSRTDWLQHVRGHVFVNYYQLEKLQGKQTFSL